MQASRLSWLLCAAPQRTERDYARGLLPKGLSPKSGSQRPAHQSADTTGTAWGQALFQMLEDGAEPQRHGLYTGGLQGRSEKGLVPPEASKAGALDSECWEGFPRACRVWGGAAFPGSQRL